MQKVVLLNSGHKLTFNTAPFDEAFELVQRISDAFAAVRIVLSKEMIEAIAKIAASKSKEEEEAARAEFRATLLGSDSDFIFGSLKALLSNRALKDQVMLCMQHCALDSLGPPQKADATFFNNDKARPDFLPAAWEVIRLNGGPFFEGLLSGSSNRGGSSSPSPGSR